MSDPWFRIVRSPGRVRITPIGAKGWASFALLMVVVLLPLGWVIPNGARGLWVVLGYVGYTLVVLAGFVRFAKARAKP